MESLLYVINKLNASSFGNCIFLQEHIQARIIHRKEGAVIIFMLQNMGNSGNDLQVKDFAIPLNPPGEKFQ